MKEVSNRQFDKLIEKLPRVLAMAQRHGKPLTLSQGEDIRQLQLLHSQLLKKKFNNKTSKPL